MREIKFRAKDFHTGIWHYGCLVYKERRCTMLERVGKGSGNAFVGFPCHSDTIGQYIGKKDKNGNEIYEGDIMQYNSLLRPEKYYRYVIAWNPIDMAFGCASLALAFLDCPDIGGGAQITDSTIIGNIHDNPELLKQE